MTSEIVSVNLVEKYMLLFLIVSSLESYFLMRGQNICFHEEKEKLTNIFTLHPFLTGTLTPEALIKTLLLL